MPTRIDHLVIAAGTLEQGVAYVRECLGVSMPFGGVHAKMGTHNHLMQLGNDSFLEVIAINRDIEPPDRPRWFGMADLGCRLQRLEIHHPYPRWLKSALASIGAVDLVQINPLEKNATPCMVAAIDTPGGVRKLRSPSTPDEAIHRKCT